MLCGCSIDSIWLNVSFWLLSILDDVAAALGCWPATCGERERKRPVYYLSSYRIPWLSYPYTRLWKMQALLRTNPATITDLLSKRNEMRQIQEIPTGNSILFSYFFLFSLIYSSLFFLRLTAKSLHANGHWSVFLENETHVTMARTRVRAYLGKRAGM